MDARKNKFKEVDISNDGQPKMAWIGHLLDRKIEH